MDFVAYLISKNIDAQKFESSEGNTFELWKSEFAQMHPKSFTSQKLFVINEVRRKFQLHIGAKPKEKPSKSAETIVANTLNTVIDEENGIKASSDNKPKPVFKKPSQSGQLNTENKEVDPLYVKTNNDTTDNTITDSAPSKTPVKPIFKRPATPQGNLSTQEAKTESESRTEENTPVVKKPMAKPVFKRPEATKENQNTTQEAKTESESRTEENTPVVKKPMAKPVFKRPEAPKDGSV